MILTDEALYIALANTGLSNHIKLADNTGDALLRYARNVERLTIARLVDHFEKYDTIATQYAISELKGLQHAPLEEDTPTT